MRALVKAGMPIDLKNRNGDTPLLLALTDDRESVAHVLFDNRASMKAMNVNGESGRDRAAVLSFKWLPYFSNISPSCRLDDAAMYRAKEKKNMVQAYIAAKFSIQINIDLEETSNHNIFVLSGDRSQAEDVQAILDGAVPLVKEFIEDPENFVEQDGPTAALGTWVCSWRSGIGAIKAVVG